MLCDVALCGDKRGLGPVLSAIAGGQGGVMPERLEQGIYTLGHGNFTNYVAEALNEFLDTGNFPAYGVCDSIEQFKEKAKTLIEDPARRFVVAFVEVKRADQSPDGGWRWHKWGEYIGTQKPRHEYLYADKHIDRVFTFSVYELLSQPAFNPYTVQGVAEEAIPAGALVQMDPTTGKVRRLKQS